MGNYNPLTGGEVYPSRWWTDEQDLLTNIEESIDMHEHDDRYELFQLIQDIRRELKPGYTAARWDDTQVCITYYPSGPDSRQRHYVKSYEEWQALKVKLNY